MSKLPKQTKRSAMIKRFRALGFGGPHTGGTGDHPTYMVKGDRVVKLPNPHSSDIGEPLLKKILAEAHLSVDQWLGIASETTTDPEGGQDEKPPGSKAPRLP